jgi:hypothetical protein
MRSSVDGYYQIVPEKQVSNQNIILIFSGRYKKPES